MSVRLFLFLNFENNLRIIIIIMIIVCSFMAHQEHVSIMFVSEKSKMINE